ncbi:Fis family transcriptional regulator [Legionella israelensis]|uniref:Putative Fis-like DNA-binding protein n=1 Tax=Legionella israelensis TaxID=454 RepID=A0A0W0W3I8_9GAMM|nr:helix-turn-helix domain-containing protein [Legionella israelensis]KTD26895.1 Fis transcriptional activator [Legionella israelensis]QBR84296.1 Fis family transcriptional regulator [Legionella israelensis]QBS08561.1 Fis family transcriptional regulator [Legionella israelensis]QDP72596.1 Fis family transcriptional regulator [Legionella israelensis]SCX76109.1 Fis family transcriptional regulator, factor for inversion stimulation protein [Legionella israelensis DSM 19235]
MNAVLQDVMQNESALSNHVISAVKNYLNTVNNRNANLNLYQLIVEEVEAPLFRTVMELTRYNQSKAARVLGVSRGTLRTKLKRYFDDEFIGTRDV